MSPALERLAIEHLQSPLFPIQRGAAEVLGRYGTPAAEKPLWEAMEYFRSRWKDREDDLRKQVGREGTLERALWTALAQAGAWVLEEPELRRLLALCSSAECRTVVAACIQEAQEPKRVEISPYLNEVRIKVAHYTMMVERDVPTKLAQFPPGTAFRVAQTRSEDAEHVRPRIEAAIRAAGHRIVE